MDPPGKPVLRLAVLFITTTWNSGQLAFTGLLGAAGLISIIDPLYYKWLAPRRWLFAMHTLTLFAALARTADHPAPDHRTKFQAGVDCRHGAVVPEPAQRFPVTTWRGVALVLVTLAVGGSGWLLRSWCRRQRCG